MSPFSAGSETAGKLSVYIIAYNEAEKIEHALKSVAWADEVIVVDSFSTDDTAKIAQAYEARVVQVPFEGFGKLREDAINACSHNWVFSLDSDERCTQMAKKEIIKIINDPSSLDAYYVPRRNYFMGKWIRHSGYYPDFRQPQLFRKGALKFMPDAVHESYQVVGEGKCGYFKSFIYQIPFKDLEEMSRKMNRYSTLGAQKLCEADQKSGMFNALSHGLWAWFSTYILKLGCLDGWPGFIISLSNFESTFYKYAKLHLKQKGLDVLTNNHLPKV